MEEDSLNKQGLSNAVNSNSRGKEVGGRGWCVDTEWQGENAGSITRNKQILSVCCWCHCLKNIDIHDRVSAINHLPKRKEHKRTDSCPESHSRSGKFETMIVFSVEGTGPMRRLCSPGHGIENRKLPAFAKINYSNNTPNNPLSSTYYVCFTNIIFILSTTF